MTEKKRKTVAGFKKKISNKKYFSGLTKLEPEYEIKIKEKELILIWKSKSLSCVGK